MRAHLRPLLLQRHPDQAADSGRLTMHHKIIKGVVIYEQDRSYLLERHRQHRAMADLVANAAAAAGASVDKFTASEFNVSSAGDYTGFALGCPAMAPSSWRRASSSRCTRICAAL